MSNKFVEKDIKNCTYYFFGGKINMENLDTKSYKNIHIYYTGYMTVKNLNYIKSNSVNPLDIIIYQRKG